MTNIYNNNNNSSSGKNCELPVSSSSIWEIWTKSNRPTIDSIVSIAYVYTISTTVSCVCFGVRVIFYISLLLSAVQLENRWVARFSVHTSKWLTLMITTTIDNPLCDGINSIYTIEHVQLNHRYHIYRFGPFKRRQNAVNIQTVHTIKAKLTHTHTHMHTGINVMWKTKWNGVEL